MTILEAIKESKTPTLMQRKSIEAAQDMLQSGETVFWAMTVNVCDHPVPDIRELTVKETINVVLVVTNQRVFFVKKMIGFTSSSIIPLWEIRSIEESISRAFRYLEIKGITQYLLIQGNIKMLRPLHAAIQQALASRVSPTAQAAAFVSTAPTLDTAQLQQLKQLYDDGVLTAEEFAAKKAQILGL